MNYQEAGIIHGKTGSAMDGILAPEQRATLDAIQREAAQFSFDYLDTKAPDDLFPEIGMATGIGKGKIIHHVIEEQIRRNPHSRILLVAGTKVILVKQTHKALSGYQALLGNGFDYIESEDDDDLIEETTTLENPLEDQRSIFYRTGAIYDPDANVHVATIQTVQSEIRKEQLNPDDYDLVIVDEVHNIGTKKRKETIDQFRNVIGFTATPYRHSGTMKMPEEYGFTVIKSLPLPDAQNLRLLPPLIGMQIDTKKLIDDIPTTTTGLIDFKALERLLKESPQLRPYIADRVAQIITADGRNYKTVVAVNFVWEAQELAKLLYQKGIKVGIAVNQQASKAIHTEEIPSLGSIERYKLPEDDENSIQVLISPYVASEGFDAPFTEVLVWASPTDSALRYTQYTGRLARRAPGKAFGIVVDCLYQTDKYRWSYNMGMWMKGDVVQLNNGLLWLGPESDIDRIGQLPQMVDLERRTDARDVNDERNKELLDLQEVDFPLTKNGLRIFVGSSNTLLKRVEPIKIELIENYPEFFIKRKNGPKIVTACTNPEWLIEELIKRGFKLKDSTIEDIKENDFPFTQNGLRIFVGVYQTLVEELSSIQEELMEEYPNLFAKRKSLHSIIDVCTDREWFIDQLLDRGFRLKEIETEDIKEDDFPMTRNGLRIFIGDYQILLKKLSLIQRELMQEYPDLFTKKNKTRTIMVCTNREWFIDQLLDRGFILKTIEIEEIEDIRENDLPLNHRGLSIFAGNHNTLAERFSSIQGELVEAYPDRFAKRKNGSHIIMVCTNPEWLIRELTDRGFRLRDNQDSE